MAVTPDGQRAIPASSDRRLKVWELESGRALQTLSGHAAGVNAVAVTPDGQRAISASNDQTLAVESTGTIGARLTDATGSVFSDESPYLVVEPPPPEAADDDDGQSRVRVPEIYEIYAPDWQRFGFTDASVAQAEESLDDYSLFVNMDNRHLRRLLTTTDYQAAGIARIKSSYLVQVAFYTFLLHEGRAGNAGIDDGLLEGYQQRELDRVAQTVVTSIAAVERIDSAAPLEGE